MGSWLYYGRTSTTSKPLLLLLYGNLFTHLYHKVPFLQGDTDLGQLSEVFKVFGTPTEQSWPVREYLLFHLKNCLMLTGSFFIA